MNLRLALLLALLAAIAATLFFLPAQVLIFGLDRNAFLRACAAGVMLVWLVLSGANRARPGDTARIIGGTITWMLLLAILVGAYAYRFEFGDALDRVMAELQLGAPQVGPGGEVTISRRLGGEFVIAGKVDNTAVSFLFDTGASTVVLRAQDAKRIGLDTAALNYNIAVTTANGSAMAAQTQLDILSVGPIMMRNVRALVARPGALNENLLGMSFLERLQSYTVERGRLILRAK